MAVPPQCPTRVAFGSAVLLLIFCGFPSPGFSRDTPHAASPDGASKLQEQSDRPDEQRIQALIRQLKDEDFDVRASAEKQLIEIGTAAQIHLSRYPTAGDHDLRLRLARISSIIESERIKRRINAFLYSDSALPGWSEFSELVDHQENFREMYVDVFEAHGSELSAIDQDRPARVRSLKELFSQYDVQRSRSTRFDETRLMAIGLIYSTLLKDRASVPAELNQRIANTFMDNHVRDSFRKGDFQEPIQGFIRKWVTLDDTSANGIAQRMMLARIYECPDGVEAAVQCLSSQDSFLTQRRNAVEMIATFGDETHFELIEPLLDDETFVSKLTSSTENQRKTYTTTLGDVALAALVHLAGQPYEAFGIELHDHFQADSVFLDFRNAGFPDETARQAALEKWRTYRKDRDR